MVLMATTKDSLSMQSHRERYFRTGRKSLTETDVNKLLSVITDLEHSALLQLAITAGIRRGDIVEIKQNNFDYETRKITFYEHKKRRTHTVYVPQNVANVIEMLKTANKGETYLFTGRADKKHGKGHLSSRQAYNIFNLYLKKAGLEKRPFHSLRSTCIKLCQKRGWKPEETAELVGDSLNVIQEHYSVPSEQEMKEVTKDKAIL
jgi:integrase